MLYPHSDRTPSRHIRKLTSRDQRFGPAAYAVEFRRIMTSFGPLVGDTVTNTSLGGTSTADKVLAFFLELDQLRLLYDYGR